MKNDVYFIARNPSNWARVSGWTHAVSSPSGARGGAPTEIEFGAF